MKKFIKLLLTVVMAFSLMACANFQLQSSAETQSVQIQESSEVETIQSTEAVEIQPDTPLKLSELGIQVTSGELTATFQLYDTQGAAQLYEQLPLELELSNFASAQWMFYPPNRLPVTQEEAYHDGKKGELSYYEPWGDAFMLYEDFYAGDEMHRLGVCLDGIDNIAGMSGMVTITPFEILTSEAQTQEGDTSMQICMEANEATIVFELNDSQAAKDLYEQLPMTISVENFSDNEKIFYPSSQLNISGAPVAEGGAGTLAYYEPWGDVVMFYGSFGTNGSLYELGDAVSGIDEIGQLSGDITIRAIE